MLHIGQFKRTREREGVFRRGRTCRPSADTGPGPGRGRTSPARSPACPGRTRAPGCTPAARRTAPTTGRSTGPCRTGLGLPEVLEAGGIPQMSAENDVERARKGYVSVTVDALVSDEIIRCKLTFFIRPVCRHWVGPQHNALPIGDPLNSGTWFWKPKM